MELKRYVCPRFNLPTTAWLFSFLLVVSPLTFAAETAVVQQIEAFLEEQRFEQAYSLALEHQDEQEGDTQFDLSFGMAAFATDHCSEAVYALERVLQVQPQHSNGRFALATCYYRLGNLSAAKHEFSQIQRLSASSTMLAAAAQALENIEKQQQSQEAGWHNAAQLVLGQDSNPNNGIEDEFITVPLLGEVRLFEQNREVSSSYYDLNASTSYMAPIDQGSRWYASVGLNYTGYSEHLALSKGSLNLLLGAQSVWSENEVGARLFYRPMWLDGDSFVDYFGLIADMSHPLMGNSVIGAELIIGQLDYTNFTELSRNQALLGLWFATPTFNGTSRLSLKVGKEEADSSAFEFNSRDLLGVSYSLQQQLSSLWSYGVKAEYLQAKYAQNHPLFAQQRDDRLLQVVLDVQYQWQSDWLLSGQLNVTDNRSNLNLYDYNRSNVWIGARYQF
jgi:hypothetical protein